MFASAVTKDVEIDGVAVRIRKLSHKLLDQASEQRQQRSAKAARDLGPEMIRAFREMSAAPAAETKTQTPEEQQRARYLLYDRDTVLRSGVQTIGGERVSPAALDDLDEDVAQRLHQAILDLSLPPLDAEAQQSKD